MGGFGGATWAALAEVTWVASAGRIGGFWRRVIWPGMRQRVTLAMDDAISLAAVYDYGLDCPYYQTIHPRRTPAIY